MIVLAIDTALDACQAVVAKDGEILAVLSEPMQRGHQERLAPMVQEAMAAAGLAFERLDRVGVTVGPGSFTGVRVGLAFAKGLSLALDIPSVGIGTLPALAASVPEAELVAAAVDARRGQVYLQLFEDGRALGEAEALLVEDAVRRLEGLGRPVTLVGSGAPLLAPQVEATNASDRTLSDPAVLARLTAAAPAPSGPPQPLYLRAPDARLPA